jgi:hypothetical protein
MVVFGGPTGSATGINDLGPIFIPQEFHRYLIESKPTGSGSTV